MLFLVNPLVSVSDILERKLVSFVIYTIQNRVKDVTIFKVKLIVFLNKVLR